MKASRDFFHQPLEEKLKCSNLVDGKYFQVEGYGNDQVKAQDQIMDWSDRLHLRVEPEDQINIGNWPKNPESFRFQSIFRSSLCEFVWIIHFFESLINFRLPLQGRFARVHVQKQENKMRHPSCNGQASGA